MSPVPAAPTISVVVPTHGRADLLPRLIAALEDQQDVGDYEVIVVDDCSPDNTQEVLLRLQREVSFPLRPLRTQRNSGPSAARNLGWRAAAAPLVAFTDDDCVPDQRWLAAISDALAGADVVQGLTEVDPTGEVGRGPFARVMIISQFSWKFETCNMGYRREILETLGGFDERFPLPYGEDCDLGWRAAKRGARLAWAPGAVVLHAVHTSGNRVLDWILLLKDVRRRRFAALMVKEHPEIRRHLYLRWFYKREHPLAIAAVLGLAAMVSGRGARRCVAGAAMTLPWAYYRTVTEPLPARRAWLWAVLPMALIADTAEVATMIRGSAQYRTFLL